MVNTILLVYVQALGGKFLGPNAYMPLQIGLSFAYNGVSYPIPYYKTGMDDGIINNSFISGNTSFMPILTPQTNNNPFVNYLTPGSNTVSGRLSVPLNNLELSGVLSASIPRNGNSPLIINQIVSLTSLLNSYRITTIIPGLYLTEGPRANNMLTLYVKMMCGCKITNASPGPSYWSPADFSIGVVITYQNGSTQQQQMQFDIQSNDSAFTTQVANLQNIRSLRYIATQFSTGNYGFLDA
ncbi:MAG: hypothetical protein QM731_12780 [Chitinophagaceae bacterium]